MPMGHQPLNFYLYAIAIGAGASFVWIAWLLIARACVRAYHLRPSYFFSVLQVVIVLSLMRVAMTAQDHFTALLGVTAPASLVFFRRIWILVWLIAMVSTIGIFLDIRRMAAAGASAQSQRRSPGRQPAGGKDLRRAR